MTAVHEETTLETPVDVRFTLDGTPLAIRHDGRIWVNICFRGHHLWCG